MSTCHICIFEYKIYRWSRVFSRSICSKEEALLQRLSAPRRDLLEATEAILRAGLSPISGEKPSLFRLSGGEEGCKCGGYDVYVRVGSQEGVAIAVDWDEVCGLARKYGFDRNCRQFTIINHIPPEDF